MADVFISYSRQDAAVARMYADAFEAEGLQVWWDVAIRSGETFDEVIEAALRSARAVVVLWSPRSVVSRWVRAEATAADRIGTLVPVIIEPCERPIIFELTHTVDLTGWQGQTDHPVWRSYIADVRRLIEKRPPGPPAETRPPPPPPAAVPEPPKPVLALPTKPSVAVRPFSNLVGGEENDYFADGMVVDIITALSRYRSLFVISAGSTLSYRGDTRASTVIARELGVRYILQGTVRKAGQQVRIAVELLDEVGLSPIWTQRFDGSLDDIFALQDMISATVASQIEPSIKASEVARAASQQSPSNSAYDLYLRGTQAYWDLWTKETLWRATELFEQAAAQDPGFALAQAYASSGLINFVLQGHAEDPVAIMGRSLEYAHAAVQVGQHDAEALSLAAYTIFLCDGPMSQIDELVQRSLQLNPGISICHYHAGYINMYAGRPELALAAYDMASRLDPRTPWHDAIQIGRAQALFQLERYAEALPLYARAEIAFPAVAPAIRRIVGICHLQMGNPEKATAMPDVHGPISPNEEFLISRYRDPGFRKKLRDGIEMLSDGAHA